MPVKAAATIRSYGDAARFLGGRPSRKVAHNTYVEDLGPADSNSGAPIIGIRFHDTFIVTYYPNRDIQLNSGGWKTVTTKQRMSQFSPVAVYTRPARRWRVSFPGTGRDSVPFTDRMWV